MADAPYKNRLLARLPAEELALIEPHLERVKMERRQLQHDAEAPIEYVYFVEQGLISILSVMGDGSAVETATIGIDGLIGMAVFHGVEFSSEQAMTQIPGYAHRVSAARFRVLLPEMPTLVRLLHRFAVFCFTIAAQNSGCNRKHTVEQRCARWLLTVHDRIQEDELGLTHDFISQMLGVRRASVTETLALLERRGLIRTGRSRVVIVDRAGLEAMVCECYRIVAASAARLVEEKPIPSPLARVEMSRDGFSTVGDGTPIAENLDEPTA